MVSAVVRTSKRGGAGRLCIEFDCEILESVGLCAGTILEELQVEHSEDRYKLTFRKIEDF
jgi:hypothetical protein